ncbi:MAG: ORF6N domain-containing protein [Spirochaetia bacterium]|nr:ORF6N domain-containing protein [Spirochaetia bacterium]
MKEKKEENLPQAENIIAKKILAIRGRRVMLDRDLAVMYGVETKVLNQSVKRNIERFPEDFMFQLTKDEKAEVVTNCDHLKRLKYSPNLPLLLPNMVF